MFKKPLFAKKKVYMDYAAATPLDSDVETEMSRIARSMHANPSGLHSLSLEASNIIEDARARVARVLGARSEEIIFTKGGTESCWIGILGLLNSVQDKIPHVITSTIEHAAVRETLYDLRDRGRITLTEIPVHEDGIIDIKKFKEALCPETVLVSIMYVNNEIGTTQPLHEIMKAVRHWRKENQTQYPYVHTDAIQATNYFHLNTQKLGVDLMSISSSKIYGPRSVGVLFKKAGVPFKIPFHQGTEDVVSILGFAKALEKNEEMRDKESYRLSTMQTSFIEKLKTQFPECRINGSRSERVPNNVHVSFPGISGERLVIELDAQGICASAKSACQSNNEGESHVLEAMYGKDEAGKWGSVRFSMGRNTRLGDIDIVVTTLQNIMTKIEKERDILGRI